MHNLVLDIGNTNGKVAVFQDRELLHYQSLKDLSVARLEEILEQYKPLHSIVSNVSAEFDQLISMLKSRTRYITFSTSINLGLHSRYESMATLGLDRWAKAIAAHRLYSGSNVLLIDAGTCITYDQVTASSVHQGGSISPGLGMRFSAVNKFTSRLPLIEWDNRDDSLPEGTDTLSAIKNGVLQGSVYEVEGFIADASSNNKDLKVLITGADARFLLVHLKKGIFAPQIIHEPYLVLKGLNEVIAFEYVQKD